MQLEDEQWSMMTWHTQTDGSNELKFGSHAPADEIGSGVSVNIKILNLIVKGRYVSNYITQMRVSFRPFLSFFLQRSDENSLLGAMPGLGLSSNIDTMYFYL